MPPIPSTSSASALFTLEYPGYVSDDKTDEAVSRLGGAQELYKAIRPGSGRTVALKLRPEAPLSHPLYGHVIDRPRLVLKVVRRRRRGALAGGDFTVSVLGRTTSTVKFRAMADFHFDLPREDPLVKLREATDDLDHDVMANFRFSDVDKPYSDLVPPPAFTSTLFPEPYDLAPNPESQRERAEGGDWIRLGPGDGRTDESQARIKFHGPPAPDTPRLNADAFETDIVEKIHERFRQRPIWTRLALLASLDERSARYILLKKAVLGLVSYTFDDGPWKGCLVRLGYDPRREIGARVYQTINYRSGELASTREGIEQALREGDRTHGTLKFLGATLTSSSHIFDGQRLYRAAGTLQLIDIRDPHLQRYIESDRSIRAPAEAADERTGWYEAKSWDILVRMVKFKVTNLARGVVVSDEATDRYALGESGLEDESAEVEDVNEDDADGLEPEPARARPGRGRKRKRRSGDVLVQDMDKMHARLSHRVIIEAGSRRRRALDLPDEAQEDVVGSPESENESGDDDSGEELEVEGEELELEEDDDDGNDDSDADNDDDDQDSNFEPDD